MKKNKSNMIKNIMYTILNQFVTLLLPFIMIPYLARTLEVTSLGINGYAYSLASFFSIISIFGIQAYGSREIAYQKDNKVMLTDLYTNLIVIKFVFTLISLIFYFLYIANFEKENIIYLCIYSIFLVNTFFDVTWFYVGKEDFKTIALRNMIIKLTPALGIFMFVQNSKDLIVYILINLIISFLSNLYLFYSVKHFLKFNKISKMQFKHHLKNAYPFFLSSIIIQVYAQLDRVVLGKLTNVFEVSIYDQGQKLVIVILGFLSTISIVMSPRMANLYNENKNKELKKYLEVSIQSSLFISIPAMFGTVLIGNEFSKLFFGDKFIGIEKIVIFHSPMLVFTSLGMIFGAQLLMQIGKMKNYNIGLIIGATSSILLNFLLIPFYSALGSTISKVITESLVCIYFIYQAREYFNFIEVSISFSKYFISSLAFFILLNFIDFSQVILLDIIFKVTAAVIIYFGIVVILKDLFFNNLLRTILKKRIDKYDNS